MTVIELQVVKSMVSQAREFGGLGIDGCFRRRTQPAGGQIQEGRYDIASNNYKKKVINL